MGPLSYSLSLDTVFFLVKTIELNFYFLHTMKSRSVDGPISRRGINILPYYSKTTFLEDYCLKDQDGISFT